MPKAEHTKRYQIRRTIWETVASFDSVEEAQAYWDADEEGPTDFAEQAGQLIDTKPGPLVLDFY